EENSVDPPQSVQRGVTELVEAALLPRNLCMMDPTWHPKRVESSPIDSRNGKRVNSVPIDDEISKVLDTLKSGAIDKNLKFAIGSSSDIRTTHKSGIGYDETNGNDGSFIKLPSIKTPLDNTQRGPVAKSSGLEPQSTLVGKM
ncbi:armadillo-type fold protein, partial [Tanacetum coccineum]